MNDRELEMARAAARRLVPPPRPPRKRAASMLPNGVTFSGSNRNPYHAQIRREGKTIHGGSFPTIKLAVDKVLELQSAHPLAPKKKTRTNDKGLAVARGAASSELQP